MAKQIDLDQEYQAWQSCHYCPLHNFKTPPDFIRLALYFYSCIIFIIYLISVNTILNTLFFVVFASKLYTLEFIP